MVFTRFFLILLTWYWVWLDITGFDWVLPGSTGFYWVYYVLSSFTGFTEVYWVFPGSPHYLPEFTGFYRVWPIIESSLTGFYWVLLGFTRFYWVSLGFSRFYSLDTELTGFDWVWLGFIGFFWIFTEFKKDESRLTGFYLAQTWPLRKRWWHFLVTKDPFSFFFSGRCLREEQRVFLSFFFSIHYSNLAIFFKEKKKKENVPKAASSDFGGALSSPRSEIADRGIPRIATRRKRRTWSANKEIAFFLFYIYIFIYIFRGHSPSFQLLLRPMTHWMGIFFDFESFHRGWGISRGPR